MCCQEGFWVGGSPHLTHWSPEYAVLCNTEGDSYDFMYCEGWMIENDGLTDRGITGMYELRFLCQ